MSDLNMNFCAKCQATSTPGDWCGYTQQYLDHGKYARVAASESTGDDVTVCNLDRWIVHKDSSLNTWVCSDCGHPIRAHPAPSTSARKLVGVSCVANLKKKIAYSQAETKTRCLMPVRRDEHCWTDPSAVDAMREWARCLCEGFERNIRILQFYGVSGAGKSWCALELFSVLEEEMKAADLSQHINFVYRCLKRDDEYGNADATLLDELSLCDGVNVLFVDECQNAPTRCKATTRSLLREGQHLALVYCGLAAVDVGGDGVGVAALSLSDTYRLTKLHVALPQDHMLAFAAKMMPGRCLTPDEVKLCSWFNGSVAAFAQLAVQDERTGKNDHLCVRAQLVTNALLVRSLRDKRFSAATARCLLVLLAGRTVPLTVEEIVALSMFGLVQVKTNEAHTPQRVEESRDEQRSKEMSEQRNGRGAKRGRSAVEDVAAAPSEEPSNRPLLDPAVADEVASASQRTAQTALSRFAQPVTEASVLRAELSISGPYLHYLLSRLGHAFRLLPTDAEFKLACCMWLVDRLNSMQVVCRDVHGRRPACTLHTLFPGATFGTESLRTTPVTCPAFIEYPGTHGGSPARCSHDTSDFADMVVELEDAVLVAHIVEGTTSTSRAVDIQNAYKKSGFCRCPSAAACDCTYSTAAGHQNLAATRGSKERLHAFTAHGTKRPYFVLISSFTIRDADEQLAGAPDAIVIHGTSFSSTVTPFAQLWAMD